MRVWRDPPSGRSKQLHGSRRGASRKGARMQSGLVGRQDRDGARASGAPAGLRLRRHWRPVVVGAALATSAPFLSMLSPTAAGAGSGEIAMAQVAAAPRIPLGDRALGAVAAGSTQVGSRRASPERRDGPDRLHRRRHGQDAPRCSTSTSPPGAFAQRFGPSPTTISAVKAQLTAQGLRVTSVARDGLLVSFSGSAGDGRDRLSDRARALPAR